MPPFPTAEDSRRSRPGQGQRPTILAATVLLAAGLPVSAGAATYRQCPPSSNAAVGQQGYASWGNLEVRGGTSCRTAVRVQKVLQRRMRQQMRRDLTFPAQTTVRGYRCRLLTSGGAEGGGGDGSASYRCSRGKGGIRVLMVF